MKNILIIFLACLCLFLWLGKKRAAVQIEPLEDGIQKQIILEDRVLIQKTRVDGSTRTETAYIPPEGGLNIRQQDDGELKLDIKDKGFTLRPFAGAFITPQGPDIALGIRLIYWQRYGLGAAWALQTGPTLALDRRLDDILPLRNTSLMLLVGRSTAGLALAVYL